MASIRNYLAAALLCLAATAPAGAMTMKECGAKYKAAKADGSLAGATWKSFRASQCSATKSDASTPSTSASTTTAPAPMAKPAAMAPATASGSATFPSAVSPKYSQETPGKARMHTCLDQYRANKAGGGNGGLRWIQKGGGYYSECTKKLKG